MGRRVAGERIRRAADGRGARKCPGIPERGNLVCWGDRGRQAAISAEGGAEGGAGR